MADNLPVPPDPQLPTERNSEVLDSVKKIDPQVRASQITAIASLIVALIAGIFALMTRPSDAVRDANKATAELEAKVAVLKDSKQFPFVPAGTIMAYGGKPDTEALKSLGWLICNGNSYSPKGEDGKYALLFDSIGFSWGRDDTDITKFRVPDLEGYFLRGVKPSDNVDRFALNGGNTNGVGSYQADGIASHSHTIIGWKNGGPDSPTTAGPYPTRVLKGFDAATFTTVDKPANFSKETRPKNAYVYYIIKY